MSWLQDVDVAELTTVGIDVGSATHHLVVSRLRLERRTNDLSSRYEVVARDTLAASPVLLTPYLDDADTIDVAGVERTVHATYAAAGIAPADVDSGVVLLTGTALARVNARALADRLAGDSGRFVCAAAGHHFEAVLAAHGSGAVARSHHAGRPVVAMDVGGGTTKLAVVVDGEVRSTAALLAGGRLVAWDGTGRLTRVENAVLPLADQLGIRLVPGEPVDQAAAEALCAHLAAAVVAQLDPETPTPRGAPLLLTPALALPDGPFSVVASGGVAEYLDDPAARGDDLGPALARALRAALGRAGLAERLRPATARIRATVVGASQFTTQVSGSTVRVGDAAGLPLHNVPVIRPAVALGSGQDAVDARDVAAAVRRAWTARFPIAADVPPAVALAVAWTGLPEHRRLRALAEGLWAATTDMAGNARVVVTVDGDVAATLGRILVDELGADPGAVLCLDNLDLADLDYVDIGRPLAPARVVPVVVKSLLFGTAGAATPGPSPMPAEPPRRLVAAGCGPTSPGSKGGAP